MRNPWSKLVAYLCLTVLAGCATARDSKTQASPELKRLGTHSFKITTTSRQAQAAFDRGLNWAYSFGHFAADQEFRAALAADP